MPNKKIYLAGKISKRGWRESIVSSALWPKADYSALSYYAHGQEPMEFYDGQGTTIYAAPCSCGVPDTVVQWPILDNAVLGIFDYVGPYFIGCDHGCFHGPNSHGSIDSYMNEDDDTHGIVNDGCGTDGEYFRRSIVKGLCLEAIHSCDVVFAWIDAPDAYGTFTELGYAAALKKEIWIAGPEFYSDMWFVYSLATADFLGELSPLEALKQFVSIAGYQPRPKFDSPIEEMFWDAWQNAGGAVRTVELEYQYNVPDTRYRVDFANVEEKVAIELDGYEYHNSKDQFTNDRKRQRELENLGWRVIRFSGSEVYKNPDKCLKETVSFITGLWYERKVAKE